MSTVEARPACRWPRTVAACYSVVDQFFPACGIFDLTEGMYHGRPDTTFEQAQTNQHDYLLDQVQCGPGRRILDVGCGYGTLLSRARQFGANPVGITVSAEQVEHCRRAGHTVFLLDYKAIGHQWDSLFDGVIANGSLEHFVQPAHARAGKANEIYRNFFQTMHRVLDPESPGRLVTTAIHFVRQPDPADLMRNPFVFRRGSQPFHFALLARGYGGWYPVAGQLERCAKSYFTLADEIDGTDDYRRTSDEWLGRVRRSLSSPLGLKIASGVLPILLAHPLQLATLLYCVLASESWNWQFRPPNPPTRLLRQTWQYVA